MTFTLFRHSSPSFGSQHTCSTADPSENVRSGRRCPPRQRSQLSLSLRARVFHPNTRRFVRLLGPCFKTGRLRPLCPHPKHVTWGEPPAIKACCRPRSQSAHTEKGYNTLPKECHVPNPFICRPKSMWTHPTGSTPKSRETRLSPERCD